MNKLVFKIFLFIAPFFISFLVLKCFYISNQGDLFRLGYFTNDYNYIWKDLFKEEFKRKVSFDRVSTINLSKKHKYDILIIGDSFSEQRGFSYHDYLAEYSGKKILLLDRFLHDNPFETVERLLLGDFFKNIECKNIILQCVERSVTNRGFYYPKTDLDVLSIKRINEIIAFKNEKMRKNELDMSFKLNFFSKDIIRFPMYRFYYLFSDNGIKSSAYNVKLSKSFFSCKENFCMFIDEDLDFRKNLCEDIAIKATNNRINSLATKLAKININMISMIAPDKYEIYYDYFVNKSNYPKPIFFDKYNKLPKNHQFVDVKKY